jgi:hypothetical protein
MSGWFGGSPGGGVDRVGGGNRESLARLAASSDLELGAALAELGSAIAFPPASPDFADRVVARIAPAPVRRTPLARLGGSFSGILGGIFGPISGPIGDRPLRRALALAVILLLLLAVVAAAIGLGVPGVRILLAPGTTPAASATAVASSGPGGSTGGRSPTTEPSGQLAKGRPVSLEEARAAAGFGVLVPSDPAFANPDGVFLDGAAPLARVTFSYGTDGLLTEFIGEADPEAFQKIVGGGTTVEALRIDGRLSYWITGEPHELLYRIPGGGDRWEEIVVQGNVLLWQRGPVTLRLETPRSRADSVRVAESTR